MEMLSCFFSELFLISGTEVETLERCGWGYLIPYQVEETVTLFQNEPVRLQVLGTFIGNHAALKEMGSAQILESSQSELVQKTFRQGFDQSLVAQYPVQSFTKLDNGFYQVDYAVSTSGELTLAQRLERLRKEGEDTEEFYLESSLSMLGIRVDLTDSITLPGTLLIHY